MEMYVGQLSHFNFLKYYFFSQVTEFNVLFFAQLSAAPPFVVIVTK